MNNSKYVGERDKLTINYVLSFSLGSIPYVGAVLALYFKVALLREVLNASIITGETTTYKGQDNDLIKIFVKGILLSLVTFGIYGIWMYRDVVKYIVGNTYSVESDCNFESDITLGTVVKIMGLTIFTIVIGVIIILVSIFGMPLFLILPALIVSITIFALMMAYLSQTIYGCIITSISLQNRKLVWSKDSGFVYKIFAKYYIFNRLTFGIYPIFKITDFVNNVLGVIDLED